MSRFGGSLRTVLVRPSVSRSQNLESRIRLRQRGPSSLWTYSLMDKTAKRFAGVESFLALSGQFSPDGRWVAYHAVSGQPPRPVVFVRPYPSTDAVYPIAPGNQPVWVPPGGTELFFGRTTQLFAVRVITQPSFATSVPTALPFLWSPGPWRNFDFTPDGKRWVGVVAAAGSESGEYSRPQIEVVLNWTEELRRLVPTR